MHAQVAQMATPWTCQWTPLDQLRLSRKALYQVSSSFHNGPLCVIIDSLIPSLVVVRLIVQESVYVKISTIYLLVDLQITLNNFR